MILDFQKVVTSGNWNEVLDDHLECSSRFQMFKFRKKRVQKCKALSPDYFMAAASPLEGSPAALLVNEAKFDKHIFDIYAPWSSTHVLTV